MGKKVVAITPARGGSRGIPRKNMKIMNGKPLLQYTIEAALRCDLIDTYIVNSEDKEIRQFAESLGIRTQNRPEDYWYDNTFQEVDRLLKWSVQDLESNGKKIDIVVLLYATAPLRRTEHITDCIDLVLNQNFDSALTLVEDRSYIWEKSDSDRNSVLAVNEVEPVNYNPQKRGPNQKEGWNQWVENKAVYVMKRDLLMNTGCRLGGRIGFTEMSKLDSIDIDLPEDFELAQQRLRMRNETNRV